MPSESGIRNGGIGADMAKKICIYGLLSAVCMALSYLESLLPLDFIAPGVKLGLANSAALLLIYRGDPKGAAAVNLTRILLSALLFSGVSSLPFSLCGAAGAWAVSVLLGRCRQISVIGMSAAGGAVHNLLQGTVALAVIGRGVSVYFPVLLLLGTASGTLVGALCSAIIKKYKISE